MIILDEKFKDNKGHYILQCALATAILMVLFSLLSLVFDTAIVAALGATSFIVFTIPFKEVSKARYVIGGYTVGNIVGFISAFLFQTIGIAHGLFGILAALSVGVSMFLMVIFDVEHPPAAGVSLGLMINNGDVRSVLVAYIGIIFILLMRKLLAKYLIDLL